MVQGHSPCKKTYESRQKERLRYLEAVKAINASQIEARRRQEAYIEAEGGEVVGIKSCLHKNRE